MTCNVTYLYNKTTREFETIHSFFFLDKKEPKNQDLHKILENVCWSFSCVYRAVMRNSLGSKRMTRGTLA